MRVSGPARRAEEVNYHDNPTFVRVFIAEQALGFVGLAAVLITVLVCPRVRRNGPWLNFLLACVLYSLSYLLLAFAGQQSGPQPDFGLCLAQAVLTYGAPPLYVHSSHFFVDEPGLMTDHGHLAPPSHRSRSSSSSGSTFLLPQRSSCTPLAPPSYALLCSICSSHADLVA
jgi:hypothetical protein